MQGKKFLNYDRKYKNIQKYMTNLFLKYDL